MESRICQTQKRYTGRTKFKVLETNLTDPLPSRSGITWAEISRVRVWIGTRPRLSWFSFELHLFLLRNQRKKHIFLLTENIIRRRGRKRCWTRTSSWGEGQPWSCSIWPACGSWIRWESDGTWRRGPCGCAPSACGCWRPSWSERQLRKKLIIITLNNWFKVYLC